MSTVYVVTYRFYQLTPDLADSTVSIFSTYEAARTALVNYIRVENKKFLNPSEEVVECLATKNEIALPGAWKRFTGGDQSINIRSHTVYD